jgi:hypothetical protein
VGLWEFGTTPQQGISMGTFVQNKRIAVYDHDPNDSSTTNTTNFGFGIKQYITISG